MDRANPSFLTRGRQTWDPMARRSVTSAKAYDRYIQFIKNNGGVQPINCLEFIQEYFKLCDRSTFDVVETVTKKVIKRKYDKIKHTTRYYTKHVMSSKKDYKR